MEKYAHYNSETNELLGWYDSLIHDDIPHPNLEVEDEHWRLALSQNANYVDLSTKRVIYKDLRSPEEIERCRIRDIKEKAKSIIYAKYDQEDQNNLAFLPESDSVRVAAVGFINNIRAISKNAILENIPLLEINWDS